MARTTGASCDAGARIFFLSGSRNQPQLPTNTEAHPNEANAEYMIRYLGTYTPKLPGEVNCSGAVV